MKPTEFDMLCLMFWQCAVALIVGVVMGWVFFG